MQQREPHNPVLAKSAAAGRFPSERQAYTSLVDILTNWTEQFGLARLGSYGIEISDFEQIFANCRGNIMSTNPIVLADDEIREILQQHL